MDETPKTQKIKVPLEEYTLSLAGRDWTVLHTGLLLSLQDEAAYFQSQRLPYGVSLWPSAIALASALSERAGDLDGATVLELGAGTGLPGLVAASLGAHVVQTDQQPMAMSVCALNAQRNEIEGIEYRLEDWTDFQDQRQYDFIIGADILYAEAFHDDLRRIFLRSLAPGGQVLIADPLRPQSREFLEDLESAGWTVDVTTWDLSEEEAVRTIGVFALQPPESTVKAAG